ncbi:MAG: hypothetical protein HOO99_16890 [Hyphomicrobiaceae bacterium]|nr:hypothetical protein [Hyphomicrobiaceae bacterium]
MSNAFVRALLVIVSLSILMTSQSGAQSPSPEAITAAKRFVAAQHQSTMVSQAFAPMATGALDNKSTVRAIDPAVKADIVATVTKAVLPRLPQPGDEIIMLFAANMTIDDLQKAADFHEGPTMQRMATAMSTIKFATGKPPELPKEAEAAMKDVTKFFESSAGKSVFKVTMDNAAQFQRASMQVLMAATTLINEELDQELKKRGLKP